MSLLRADKKVLILFILSLIHTTLFAMSVNYFRPSQPFDSQMRLRAMGNLDSPDERWNFGYSGTVNKSELPDVFVQISGPGGKIYQQYGHVGIVLRFKSIGEITFDYGVFNTKEKNFAINFLHGNLYYYLWCHRNYQDGELKREGRSNKYYLLELSDEQKKTLVDFLIYNSKDENKHYLYDFFKDNCSTRVRDVLDKLYDGRLSEKYGSIPCGTYRTAIERAIRPYPAIELIYNVFYGSSQDRPISFYDVCFLPEYLEIAIAESGIGTFDEERSANHTVIYRPSVVKDSFLSPNYLLYLIIAAVLFTPLILIFSTAEGKPGVLRFTGLIAFVVEFPLGLLSLLFTYAQLFTTHSFTWFNYNMIFINPFMLFVSCISFSYFLHPHHQGKIFVDLHKISSSLVLVALFGKLFYRQVNLYLIIFFILFYHLLIICHSDYNTEHIIMWYNISKKFNKFKKKWIR